MNASGLVKCDAFNVYWFRLELAVNVIFAQSIIFRQNDRVRPCQNAANVCSPKAVKGVKEGK